MFVNLETGRPAWLLQHDNDVLFSTVDPTDPGHTRHHKSVTSYEFFSTHREATADELAGAKPKAGAVSMPMQRTQATAPTVTPAGSLFEHSTAKPKATAKKKPAAKKKAAPKAAAKPAPKEPAKAADKSADVKPAGDTKANENPPPPRSGPHGEQGRD